MTITTMTMTMVIKIIVTNFKKISGKFSLILLSMLSRWGGRQGMVWGFDIFFKNLPSNSLPKGKSFEPITAKFPHLTSLHIAVHPKAGPKKGTVKISPNKTRNCNFFFQFLLINGTASPEIHVPVKAEIIRFNHSVRVLIHCMEYRNL